MGMEALVSSRKRWCPTCRKEAYRTLELATRRAARHGPTKEPYPCPTGSGWYHYGEKQETT